MLVFECKVTEREDGTIEAEPMPESARMEAKRRIADAKTTSAEQPS